MRRLTGVEISGRRNFLTDDSYTARLTLTLSMREAFSLVRVLGPIGLKNGDCSFTRLFAAMHVCQRALLRARGGRSTEVIAALQVLQVAVNDHLWMCRDVADMPKRLPPSKMIRAAAAKARAAQAGRVPLPR